MTSSPTQLFLNDIASAKELPLGKLAYFRARLSGRIHQVLLRLFSMREADRQFTRRDLAKRIHRKPEQITRWLSYPNNLTLDTASDLLIGLGYEIDQVVLVDVSTGKKIALPEGRTLTAFHSSTPAHRMARDNQRHDQSNVIDLATALRASLVVPQQVKEERRGLRGTDSALSQLDTAPSHVGELGLAAQDQRELRRFANTSEKRA